MIVTFLPAAGQSARMGGRDKLLEEICGEPLLRRMATRALAAKLGPVLVGLRPGDRARRKALRNLALDIVHVPDADAGFSATLRAGAKAALAAIQAAAPSGGDYEYDGMLVFLPDMPEIETADLVAFGHVFQARGGPVVRGTTETGTPGHPVLFPENLLHDFGLLEGDKGAAALLEGERIVDLKLPGDRAVIDLDTPEDWSRWRG